MAMNNSVLVGGGSNAYALSYHLIAGDDSAVGTDILIWYTAGAWRIVVGRNDPLLSCGAQFVHYRMTKANRRPHVIMVSDSARIR